MSLDAVFALSAKILAVIVLVLLNGFFVAAEFALVKVRDTQLEPYVAKGIPADSAQPGRSVERHTTGYHLGEPRAGLDREPVFVSLLQPLMKAFQIESPETQHSIAFGIGFSVITFLHIVAGELASKSLAIRKSVPTSLWVAIPLELFFRVSYPFIWALNHAANWLLRRFGIEPVSKGEIVHSEDELRLILTAAPSQTREAALDRDRSGPGAQRVGLEAPYRPPCDATPK
jgi:CBS domain containing-hemolysin-like protein